jgi:hypothetical protein
MINQRYCPFCKTPAIKACPHLALAVEGRDFVHRCVEASGGHNAWLALCNQLRAQGLRTGNWSPDQDDFTWLETAFCEKFLKRLLWFGGMDHEWRNGPRTDQGGFWVLLWSKDPRQLWWELREEFDRQVGERPAPENSPWLIPLEARETP